MKKFILKVEIALLVLGFLSCFLSICYASCSEETLIKTSKGDKKISKIQFGDLVISDGGEIIRVIDLTKIKAKNWLIVHVEFDDGIILEATPNHPLGPNKYKFENLMVGHEIDGHKVASVKLIPYKHKYIYDILPQSRSGAYYANGVLIGSSLWKTK